MRRFGWCLAVAVMAEEVTIATYNIRTASKWAVTDGGDERNGRLWAQRRAKVAKSIEIAKATIVGTQEGLDWQLDDLISLLGPSWRRVGGGRFGDGSDEDEHAAILYDTKKVSLLETRDFWLSETPEKKSKSWNAALPRIATLAKFKVNGFDIVGINSHFDHGSEKARTEAAKLLLDVARQEKVDFLTGDFNAPKNEEWFDRLLDGHYFLDAWPSAQERSCGSCRSGATYHAWQGTKTDAAKDSSEEEKQLVLESGTKHIDAIFLSQRYKHNILKARVITDDKRRKVYGGTFASDHYPIAVTFSFLPPSPDL